MTEPYERAISLAEKLKKCGTDTSRFRWFVNCIHKEGLKRSELVEAYLCFLEQEISKCQAEKWFYEDEI